MFRVPAPFRGVYAMSRKSSTHQRGISLMDIIALVALMGLLFVIIFAIVLPPPLGGRRGGGGRRMQNATQVRGIQQGMVLYAQGNKNYYPGFDKHGNNQIFASNVAKVPDFLAADFSSTNPTAAVYALLMNGSYFTPEYAISPLEPNKVKATPGSTPITTANYSYALLSVADPTADKGRREEWTDTNNSQTPIAGDRSKAIDPTMTTTSIHVQTTSTAPTDWQGNVVWNDNHVTFETTALFTGNTIKIGTSTGKASDFDDLFDGKAVGSDLPADTNALFAY